MTSKLQMTLQEIDEVFASSGLNLDLLKEAMRQTELKIVDENARKERIDSRAYTLLSVFLGLIGIIYGSINAGYIKYPIFLGLAGAILVVSALLLFAVLKPRLYSTFGTFPHTWLSKDYLKSYESAVKNNNVLGLALARILYALEINVLTSDESNNKRLSLLDKALAISQLALLPILLSIIYEIYSRF